MILTSLTRTITKRLDVPICRTNA